MRRARKHFDDETEVDMTPMLDIVFIMLIFFIVTTSFVKEEAIVLNRPKPSPDTDVVPPEHLRPIVIEIDDLSVVRMDRREVDVNAIRANVETARAKKPKAAVVVVAHEKAKAGVVVSAVDQAKMAGAEQILVDKKKD
ncbi:MAG: biopolymer transporter ExbD [Gammaproteobacteria bacterium]|nr:biopolymer transporter ExbD [Gammaproteobacteria bacterium]MDH5631184.1 biopolymer transporter ExbD [Gammaproteobacteria bacterium]